MIRTSLQMVALCALCAAAFRPGLDSPLFSVTMY